MLPATVVITPFDLADKIDRRYQNVSGLVESEGGYFTEKRIYGGPIVADAVLGGADSVPAIVVIAPFEIS